MSVKRILVADDQPQVQELVQVTLDIGTYEVQTVKSGPEAVSAFSDNPFDLVILDVMMPGSFDGLETARKIKVVNPDIPIIFLSAKGQESDIDAGKEAGGDHYLIKPFSPLELLTKVETLLQG